MSVAIQRINDDSHCSICDVRSPFHDNICIPCYEKCINDRIDNVKIDIVELLAITNHELQKKMMKPVKVNILVSFLQLLTKNMDDTYKHDPRITSQCPCGHVNKRNFSKGIKAHNIYCDTCKNHYCSDCLFTAHFHNDKVGIKTNMTCKQFKKHIDNSNSELVMKWKSQLCSVTERAKLLDEIKSNEQMQKFLLFNDARYCPYSTWEDARNYEKYMMIDENDKLTNIYNEQNWHKVACPSNGLPITKTNCDDVICGRHNPERALRSDGRSQKGCDRRILWRFWPLFNPQMDNCSLPEDYSNVIEKTKKIIVNKPYNCSICKQSRKCIAVRCLDYNCPYKYDKICGVCICSHKNNATITLIDQRTGNISILQMKNGIAVGRVGGNTVSILVNNQNSAIARINGAIWGNPFSRIDFSENGTYRNVQLHNLYDVIVEINNEEYNCIGKNHNIQIISKNRNAIRNIMSKNVPVPKSPVPSKTYRVFSTIINVILLVFTSILYTLIYPQWCFKSGTLNNVISACINISAVILVYKTFLNYSNNNDSEIYYYYLIYMSLSNFPKVIIPLRYRQICFLQKYIDNKCSRIIIIYVMGIIALFNVGILIFLLSLNFLG